MVQKNILVIDDEEAVVNVIKLHLERKGHKVHAAYDGVEGLKKAQEIKPDLIILDMNMPKKSGLEFYKDITLNGTKKLFPVLVLTIRTEFEALFKDLGADGFVPKPIDFKKLIEKVETILKVAVKEKPKVVLIVDDNEQALEHVVVTFVRAGFVVHCIKGLDELTGQMSEEPLDLMAVRWSLKELVPELRKIPKLMRIGTKALLFASTDSDIDLAIAKGICGESGMAPAEFMFVASAGDILRASQEILARASVR